MPYILRPMLACNEVITDYDALTYPLIASPKLDGWRSINIAGEPRTRSGKAIPNESTRIRLSLPELDGLDGELICGSPTDPNAMQRAQSAFSTHAGRPEFTWYIFDDWRRLRAGYWDYWLREIAGRKLPEFCQILPQEYIQAPDELERYASEILASGYEGLITRTPSSPYKHNRSTRRQEWMLKIKPYTYDEGRVIRLNEKETNLNEAEIDELGFTRRSAAKDGKVGANTLGSFTISCLSYSSPFNIGCGHLDAASRQLLWDTRATQTDRLLTFRHFAQTGVVNKPRMAQFVAFRAPEDIG